MREELMELNENTPCEVSGNIAEGERPEESLPLMREETGNVGEELGFPCAKEGGTDEGEDGGIETVKSPAPAAAPDPRLDEVRRFAAHFPGVQGEDVPPEVWDMVRGGLPLTAAYAIHQNRALRFELETLKQNAAARERSTGSMTGLGERHTDPLDEGWYDD